MYIENIQITNFGNLTGLTINLKNGVNIIEGDNESGKSTVAAFIKFVFYGFSNKAERTMHLSFSTDTAEGSLTLSCKGKRYRVERRVVGGRDECRVIELPGNTLCFAGKVPGEVFFGVPEKIFESTAYIRQLDGSRIEGREVGEAVDNILFSADENINIQKSLKKIDDARIGLLYKNKKGGKIYEFEKERDNLSIRLASASEASGEIISLEGTLEDLKLKIKETTEKYTLLRGQLEGYAVIVRRRRAAQLSELKRRLDECETACRKLREENSKDGFFPDRKYIGQIRELLRSLDSADKRIMSLESEIAKLAAENRSNNKPSEKEGLNRVELLKRQGGKEGFEEKVKEYNIKRRTMLIYGIIFSILSAPAIILTVVIYLFYQSYGIVTGIGALILLFGAIICFYMASRYAKRADEMFDMLGINETGELDRINGDANANGEDMTPVASLESERAKLELERAEIQLKLNELVSIWKSGDAATVIAEAEQLILKYEELNTEAKKQRSAYESVKTQLQDMFENELPDDGRPVTLPENFNPKAVNREYDFVTKAMKSLEDKKHIVEVRLAELYAKVESPSSLTDKINALDYKINSMTERYEAYRMAYDMLVSASEGLRDSMAPKLSEYAGKIMGILTNGKYEDIGVGRELDITFNAGGKEARLTRGAEYMSAGTGDLAYISLRMALLNLLCRDETPPLVFDESFARLDDRRLKNTLGLLSAMADAGTQIIVMTAIGRESELMGDFRHERIHI